MCSHWLSGNIKKSRFVVCQFPRCKYFHLQAVNTTSLNTELGIHSQLSQESMSQILHTTAFNGILLVTGDSLPTGVAHSTHPSVTDLSGSGTQTQVLLPSAVHTSRTGLSLVKQSRDCILWSGDGDGGAHALREPSPCLGRAFCCYRLWRAEIYKVFQACVLIPLWHSALLHTVLCHLLGVRNRHLGLCTRHLGLCTRPSSVHESFSVPTSKDSST